MEGKNWKMNFRFRFRPIDKWPREKNKNPRNSLFRTTYRQTLELLAKELLCIEAKNVVIQVDLPESKIRNDGLPYSTARPEFQGVILYFESKYGPLKYLTDAFNDWQENLRAIALGLEALRKVDRYCITSRGEQYTGWKALPSGEEDVHDKMTASAFISKYSNMTEIDIRKNREILKVAYRQAAQKLHPDKGGDPKLFNLLQKARKLLTS